MLALVLLAAGGGVALVMHRRRSSSGTPSVALIDVIETQDVLVTACEDQILNGLATGEHVSIEVYNAER